MLVNSSHITNNAGSLPVKSLHINQTPSKTPPTITSAAAAVSLALAPPVLTSELPLAVFVTPTVAVSILVKFPTPTSLVYVTPYFVAASLALLEYSVIGFRLIFVAHEVWVVVMTTLAGMCAPTQQ